MARKEWERLTTIDELRKLVGAAQQHLRGGEKDER